MIGDFPAVGNFNQLFLKLNRFICNSLPFLSETGLWPGNQGHKVQQKSMFCLIFGPILLSAMHQLLTYVVRDLVHIVRMKLVGWVVISLFGNTQAWANFTHETENPWPLQLKHSH